MQLFHTPYVQQWDVITISEDRVVHQLKHVLRAKPWYECNIQYEQSGIVTRFHCSLTELKDTISAKVLGQETHEVVDQHRYLAVALPNKLEKMEVIVQKCTEMWLQHIIFFPSQYSQVREISTNKQERLWKIALEAVEQSYGWHVPEVIFTTDIQSYLDKWKVFVMHQDGILISHGILFIDSISSIVLIWPEWWRWEIDQKLFDMHDATNVSLWKAILRTETAAIVAAWELAN
jgi:16S rRNA (uracil1498-N3)-methyltransferase